MAEEMREVPVLDVAHPLVDEVGVAADGTRWLVTESRAPVIFLTPGRVDLINRAAGRDRRVVLVTDEHSRLSPVFSDVWREAGASWVVKDAHGGLREGFGGRRLTSVDQAWTAGPVTSIDELAVTHLRPSPSDAVEITAIVSIRLPARESSVLGGPLASLSDVSLGSPPQLWDTHEPLGQRWDRTSLTTFVRSRMPRETMVLAGGPGLAASISAQRTQHGVEEITHAHLSLTRPTPEKFDETRRAIMAALARLTETSMPLVALLLAHSGRSDLLRAPLLQAPPAPLCLLVGPPAVRALDLAPERLSEQFAAQIVGRPRIPGLLFGLGDDGPQAWARLDAILAALGADRVQQLLGGATTKVAAARAARSQEGDDAQP